MNAVSIHLFHRRRRLVRFVLGVGMAVSLFASIPREVKAADWPSRPIRLLVGFPPGGGTDTVARVLAKQLTLIMGQSVVIENRPGAGGIIATEQVIRSPADGYTLLLSTASPLTGAPLTVKGLQYDPAKDLIPVTLVGNGPFILVANPSFPPNTLGELITYAKAHPGQVNYASPGSNTANYFLTELMNMETGMHTVQVPYKGSAGLITDLIGGQVQFTLDTPGTTLPLIRDHKLKALVLLNNKRLDRAPTIPTVVEAGYPQLVGGSWYGILAPQGTPKPIVDKIYQSTVAALKTPEMRTAMSSRDVLIQGSTPEEFSKFIAAEYTKWKTVTQRLGIVPN
jgi:tripartite-type tricarboxylate transporter receptor subunit TctC